jgi:tyrosinase
MRCDRPTVRSRPGFGHPQVTGRTPAALALLLALALLAARSAPAAGPIVRKNVKDLTAAEQQLFVDAMFALKAAAPHVAPGGDMTKPQNLYEEYVKAHDQAFTAIHGGPFVLPWHREALFIMERDVRAMGGQFANFAVPYWDWTRDPFPSDKKNPTGGAAIADGLMGGNGIPGNADKVKTGPFGTDAATWTTYTGAAARDNLKREFAAQDAAGRFNQLIADGPAAIVAALAKASYAVPGAGTNYRGNTDDFRFFIEKEPGTHDAAHVAVGGDLGTTTAGMNDPTFWMLHNYMDLVWARWECTHGPVYAPDDTVPMATSQERLSDPLDGLAVFNGGNQRTPKDTLNFLKMGYTFQFDGKILEGKNCEKVPAPLGGGGAGGGDDTGFIPPTDAIAKCEAKAAAAYGKMLADIGKCHRQLALGILADQAAEESCEGVARGLFDVRFSKLRNCPACLDATTIKNQGGTIMDVNNGIVFCDGTTPFGGDDTGFIPPQATKNCEDGAAKALAKLIVGITKCHRNRARGKLIDHTAEEACEDKAKLIFDKKATLLSACPPCLNFGTVKTQYESALDANTNLIFCASPSGAFLDSDAGVFD